MKPLRSFAPACLAAAGLMFLAQVAGAQALQQVPSDALVVVQVKNLQGTSQKMAAFSQKLGIAQMNPNAADPLGTLKKQMNLQKGLDETKDAAIVLPNLPARKKDQPEVVVLLPVSNYKQFLENFDNPQQQGDVTVIKLPNDPDDSYVVNWGNYAAIGTS